MRTKHTIAATLVAVTAAVAAFGQASAPQPRDASPSRVLAGVRDFTPDALRAMTALAEHREWLDTAAKAIQAGGKPDLADPKMPAEVKDALATFSDVPELVLLLAARPDELGTLRKVMQEAPDGVAAQVKQFRTDYTYAHREGAIAWQRMLQSDPVALGQYREYLTKYCEQQKKAVPGFATVRVTNRDYYLAAPPDDALMTFAHEASPPEALGRLMAQWWDAHGTAAVDEQVVDRSVEPRLSMVQGAVIDLPSEQRKAMWRPADEQAIDTLGLMPVILQPFADQPDPAKVARAVQELARVWSLGDAPPQEAPAVATAPQQPAPEAPRFVGGAPVEPEAPAVAEAPVQQPVSVPAEFPDMPVEELAQQAEANGSYTVLEPTYTWPGVTTIGLSSYSGFCYTPYSSWGTDYSYVYGYPYWYCPPPTCGTTYMYYPHCRPAYAYWGDYCGPYGGSGFGIYVGSGIRRYGLYYGGYYDNDCGRRYGVYQYHGDHGDDYRHDGRSPGRYWGESGAAIKDRPGHDSPGRGDRLRPEPRLGDGRRDGSRGDGARGDGARGDGGRGDGRSGVNRLGHLGWNSNEMGRAFSGRGDRRSGGDASSPAPDGRSTPGMNQGTSTPRRSGGLRNPWATPRSDSGASPRDNSSGGERGISRIAPRGASANPGATGQRSTIFDNLRSLRQNRNSDRATPSRSPANNPGIQRSSPAPRPQSAVSNPISRLQAFRQNATPRSSGISRPTGNVSRPAPSMNRSSGGMGRSSGLARPSVGGGRSSGIGRPSGGTGRSSGMGRSTGGGGRMGGRSGGGRR